MCVCVCIQTQPVDSGMGEPKACALEMEALSEPHTAAVRI